MENKIAIKVNNLVKVYKMYNNKKDMLFENISPLKKNRHTDYYALNGISFDVKQGETFGIIGTNGAGKSTLLKMITGVSSPTEGTVEVNGKVAALLELGAGFNVEYSGIDNIYLNGTMMGYSKKEMEQRIPQILEFADIGDFIYQPVKTYSSGMFARLAFSVAINVEPDILIVDEALSVGDVYFQNKCYRKFEELKSRGTTVIFVSHDIQAVKQMCSRVLWIEKGIMQMCGDSIEVCNEYTNSILKKGHASEKETDVAYKVEKFNTTNFPAISYTNDSILNDSVKIISCFIEDKNGIKVNECKINEKYTVSVVFESYREIKSCIAGFVIETVKGLWVINTNSSICGNKGSFYVKKGSLNRVDFTFVMPPLMRAEYVMGVAVAEGTSKDYEILTWLYNAFAVNIVNNGNNSALIDVETEIKIYEKEGKEET
jgi:ABC-type polysaccharide/polyol phosphate transport system ATPase subunit